MSPLVGISQGERESSLRSKRDAKLAHQIVSRAGLNDDVSVFASKLLTVSETERLV
jgi:hypothetical protein